MAEKLKEFYDTLIENLDSYNGEYASFIDCGPNLFKLMCDILEYDITKEIRRDLCGAIAYYVVPMDVFIRSGFKDCSRRIWLRFHPKNMG